MPRYSHLFGHGVALVAFTLGAKPPTSSLHEVKRGEFVPVVRGGCDYKLVSWNIERGEQLEAVIKVLKQQSPDILLLQEVDLNANRTGKKDVAGEVARQLGLNYLFAAEFQELGQGGRDRMAYHGQAVMTRLKTPVARALVFKDQSDFWRPRWFVPNWAVFQRREGARLTLVVEAEAAGRPLVLYDVHLESRATEEQRRGQMAEVIADSKKYAAGTRIIVAGDFNTRVPAPPAARALEEAGFRRVAGSDVSTIHGTALDWIYVRGDLNGQDGKIHSDIRASDHFPLSAKIVLVGAPCPAGKK